MPEEDQLSSRAHPKKNNDETTDFQQLDLKKGKLNSFTNQIDMFKTFDKV